MMNSRPRRLVTFAVLLALAAVTAYGGGWSIITLADFPDYVVAGEPVTLTFSVRQHGNHLIDGLKPALRASTTGGLQVDAEAKPTGNKGEYSATLRLANPGEWTIRVDGGFNAEDKTRSYNALTLPSLAVVRGAPAGGPTFSEAERGSRLFVAKGCVGCHAAGTDKDVTKKQFAGDYLTKFLADPSIRKVDMPNLKLKASEISSLIAFLNGHANRTKKKASE
jgi:hypothetical protein